MTTEVTDSTIASDALTFDAIPLSEPVRRAVDEMGWVNPTPVQLATYEPATGGKDLIVQARTGTGKTGAFGLVLADKLIKPDGGFQALVLAPTRELALQSAREMNKIGQHNGIKVSAVYGGAPFERQVKELEDGAQIVSGTPGRVLDHLKRGTLKGEQLKVLVLDEADEMLSMGFAEELHAIMEHLPKQKQVLLFSATVDRGVQRVASRHMTDPESVALSSDAVGATTISHYTYMVSGHGKVNDLKRLLEVEDPESAIIFCNTKAETELVAQTLSKAGYNATWLNGDLAQSDREKVMKATREGKLRYLVATDVAARGIDVSHVTHVINYDFPDHIEQYIHRTGRTGRAGRTGTALTLVSPQQLGGLYYLRLQYKIFPVERDLPSPGEERTRKEADRLSMLKEAFAATKPTDSELALSARLFTHPDAERIVAGLLGAFFGRYEDADEMAADARRDRRATPAPALEASADEDKKSKKKKKKRDEDKKSKKKKKSDSDAPEARAKADDRDDGRRERTARTADADAPAAADPHPVAETRGDEERPARRRARRSDTNESRDADRESDEGSNGGGESDENEEDMTRLYVNVGRRDGLRAGDIARLLRENCELERTDIGRVRVRDKHAFVDVAKERVDQVLSSLPGQVVGERELLVEVARGS